jgi:glycosyltransferase involved in cell wall biosynthesis
VKEGVLFVGHEATRSGAPIALLHFLRWYKKNGGRPFSVLLCTGGEITGEFEAVAETWVAERSHWIPGGTRAQILRGLGMSGWAGRAEKNQIAKFAARRAPALVYVNSIASGRTVDLLQPTAPLVTHVHELAFSFQMIARLHRSELLPRTRQFVACANAVRDYLMREHGIAPERIETVYESIPVADVKAARTRMEVLGELAIPADAQIVISCGTASWRKGADLFVQLAQAVSRQRPNVYFLWVGSAITSWDEPQFHHDVRLAGLNDKVRFIGTVANPADYLATADVFALTSREDPYPLVCLEAAALGKPIVCFADAGGIPEFVEEDCGYTVPYLDVGAMAQRAIELLDSPERRCAMGEAARRKVAGRHDVSKAAPRIAEIIERTIAKAKGR